MNKKIALSMLTIGVTLAMVTGATLAFFSDTETSADNTFTAGQIDLNIDNTAYRSNAAGTALELQPGLGWTATDLTDELFFDYSDLKPGDYGEDTMSYSINDNPGWGCFNITLTGAADNSINEPEDEDLDTTDGPWAGELDNELEYIVWIDDGDNVLDDGETIIQTAEDFSGYPQNPGGDGKTFTLADYITNNVGGAVGDPLLEEPATYYLGVGWCFGTLTAAPVTGGTGNPIADGPGFTCDGAGVADNQSQGDDVVGTLKFYATQYRNNASFDCGTTWDPNP